MKFTSSGPEGSAYGATVIGAKVLDIRTQLITGYKGSSDFVVGAIRGDGDAVIAPVTSLRPMLQSKTVRVLATFEPKGTFPGIPDAAALGKPELGQILSTALNRAMADPRTVSLAKKFEVEMTPSSPEQAIARIRENAAFFAKWKTSLLV